MRAIALLLAAALVANECADLAVAQQVKETVVAQAEQRPGGLFKFLFGGKRRGEAAQPRVREQAREPRRERIRKLRTRRQKRSSTQSASRPAPARAAENYSVARLSDAPPELDASKQRILVVGDFNAKALAQGLADALSENPNIEVISAGNGSSGLVRDDFYNWNEALPQFVGNYKPSAIVVMIGGNDRQAIRTGNGTVQPRTEAWDAAYRERVGSFMELLKATGVPVFWAGLVPVRSPGMSRDYSSFNTIYREKAPAAGIVFVEMWNGFADSDGRFVTRGPDVNGQNRQLRVSDGLNFTSDGRRKLAFFVERDLRQVLKASGGPQFATAPTGDDAEEASPVSAMVSLDTYAVDTAAALSTFGEDEAAASDVPPSEAAGDTASATTTTPEAALVAPGRVDDYRWPRPSLPAADPAAPEGAAQAPATAPAGG